MDRAGIAGVHGIGFGVRRLLAVLAFAMLGAGASAADGAQGPATPEARWQVSGPEAWGSTADVVRISRLRFSGQPDPAAVAEASKAGVSLVINLRTPAEMARVGFDEREAVEAAGMRYVEVPVEGADMQAASFEQVEAIVAAAPDQTVWIHCASSQRAGAFLAWHMGRSHGLPADEAVALGRDAGMQKAGLEKQVRAMLAEPATPAE